ncbi:MAG: NAD(P)-dependent oxidoreductase [Alphaproteobacteria bacterium]
MIVLGSTYLPIMDRLAEKLRGVAVLRPYDVSRPLVAQIDDVDVLIVGHQTVTADDMAAAPRLALLQQHGHGLDSVDRAAAAKAGITVANVPGGNSVAVAEHCLALLLAEAKHLGAAAAEIAAGRVGAPATIELAGKTVLVVGLGASGNVFARLAAGLDMRVVATKARPDERPAHVAVLEGPDGLPALLPQADFVVLTTPLNDVTRGMIGAVELGLMKPSAYIINSARGALVDYEALLAALNGGVIAGAAFDTFWREPADPADPLVRHARFTLTPHVAGFSDSSIEYVSEAMADNVIRLAEGTALKNVVSYQVSSGATESGSAGGGTAGST